MLGEAALTAADAQAYMVSTSRRSTPSVKRPTVAVFMKVRASQSSFSALHPRYSRAQYDRVMEELYPRLKSLTLLARQYDIGINIDAEEADRLEISLDLLENCALSQNWQAGTELALLFRPTRNAARSLLIT